MRKQWSFSRRVKKWRSEIPSIPRSFFDDSRGEIHEVSTGALLLLMIGCVLTGLIPGFVLGAESARPAGLIIDEARSTGYQNGFEDGLASLPDGQARVLFRQDDGFNRSIAFTYPEQNLSYECQFSRRTVENGGGEWAIDRQAFKYNGTVNCSTAEKDLIPAYSGADVSDTLLRNEIKSGNESDSG